MATSNDLVQSPARTSLVHSNLPTLNHKYTYKPLQGSLHQRIRILELLPSEGGSQIHSCLREGSIDDEFIAVSYVWGPKAPTHEIIIDGCGFLVKSNLFDFLMEFRDEAESLFLWIDTICINQDDLEERGLQVDLMGKIFGRATYVVAWMGRLSYHPGLELLQKYEPPQWGDRVVGDDELTAGEWFVKIWLLRLEEHFLRPATVLEFMDVLKAILDICCQPYWKRLWIVQEVILSSKLILRWGPHSIPLDYFTAWCLCVGYGEPERRKIFPNLSPEEDQDLDRLLTSCRELINNSVASHITPYRTAYREGKKDSLFVLMLLHGKKDCEDVRDRVIGLLGLAEEPPGGHPSTKLFYKLGLRDFCTLVAGLYCFMPHEKLVLFSYVGIALDNGMWW